MPLVNRTDMLQHAYRHGYAVGALGVASWNILEGVVGAAEAMRSPVILSLSKTYPGAENIESMALAVVRWRGASSVFAGRRSRSSPVRRLG